MITTQPHPSTSRKMRILARLFDIRMIIALLIGIYGIVLVVAGIIPDVLGVQSHQPGDANTVDLEAGTRANLWVGLIMVAVAALFAVWAVARPLPVDDKPVDEKPSADTAADGSTADHADS
ncbi:MAG: hypothetical protein NTW76_14360 [Corynebacteriales bacterium]|uniref:Uncharacterized protein n=1 Tax=Williamsia herbipolensis TaxID=1603258 RepID=A0AAU4K1T5_9NOCA|nr:hypothetical protein [Williamsia herbipolensis]MCX6470481.1 hypothetical protein [Mycobacteriales bacterium]